MPRTATRRRRWARALLAAGLVGPVLALAGCAGGGPSDEISVSGQGRGGSGTTLRVVAYAVAKPAFDVLVPAFEDSPAGEGIEVQVSYGPSGDQSRKVAAGSPADLVVLAAAPDISRLVEAGRVSSDWDQGPTRGVAFSSVVTLVVRPGNPHGIDDWPDLLAPGTEVVTPNPFSSGTAKWNLLAPYAAASAGGTDPAAGLELLDDLVTEHVRLQPSSGRAASDAFLQGIGDVLIASESEALFLARSGAPLELVTPPQTLSTEVSAAVLRQDDSAPTATARAVAATAFLNFVTSPEGRRLVTTAGFHARDAAPTGSTQPERLWRIDDLGGWPQVDATLFARDSGAVTRIYSGAGH